MKTIEFNHVYVKGRATAVGPMEKQGPLHSLFDKTYDDLYCNESTFEKGERMLVYDVCDLAMRKANIKISDLSLLIGGDLINQLTSSHYFARDLDVSFIGMYGACSNSSLVIGQGSLWVENGFDNVMCFTSSHNATAERQFRYPNEYGVQKKECTTYTVTGAGALILSKTTSSIKVKAFTIGQIVDWDFKDANDMGTAMAPAALETLKAHLHNRHTQIQDYDAIVSGDLSKIGFSLLCDLLLEEGYDIDNRLNDCGLLIYDLAHQSVYAGGSGCACSMCVSLTLLLNKVASGEYKRLLVIATGALLSPVATQQKESIPCIAHAIEYEWSGKQ
ncbi:MAG: stage V sporulation protein AD [Erysipelotrichia bacterium]|nr:stage V sporulation protein AD [Erysipelotrichia bacterium]NCC55192.1 stage V sporulation protein AD [Erysipelotrichia bacterium]